MGRSGSNETSPEKLEESLTKKMLLGMRRSGMTWREQIAFEGISLRTVPTRRDDARRNSPSSIQTPHPFAASSYTVLVRERDHESYHVLVLSGIQHCGTSLVARLEIMSEGRHTYGDRDVP